MEKHKKLIALSTILALSLGLFSGCGGSGGSGSGGSGSATAESDEKVLNIATIGETSTLSPLYMIADNRPTQKTHLRTPREICRRRDPAGACGKLGNER